MPAHRRASSVGRYAPVIGEPGDITDSYTSGAMTPSMRRMSGFPAPQTTIHVGRTSADDEYEDDEYEEEGQQGSEYAFKRGKVRLAGGEKDGFANPSASSPMLPSSRVGAGAGAAWRSVDGSRYRGGGTSTGKRNWSLRGKVLLFVVVAGAVGGLAYFVFVKEGKKHESFEDWWHRFELENYVPEWIQGTEQNETSTSAATTSAALAGNKPQKASSWSKALDAIIDQPTPSASFGRWGRPTAASSSDSSDKNVFDDYSEGDELSTDEAGTRHDWTVSSSYKDSSSFSSSSSGASSIVGQGRFADSVGKDVLQMAANGSLSAYKWHATLPSLAAAATGSKGSSWLKSAATKADGRIIVVGDLHGTHRSLVSLLHGVSYSTSRDTLLHTGDVVTKSNMDDSLRTLALLRQYGAKGVRGNNDQKVLEWRKWMEAYGPMPLPLQASSSSSSSKSGKAVAVAQKAVRPIPDLKAEYRPLYGGAPKYGARPVLPAPRWKKARRSWLGWFTGTGESGEDEMETEQDELASSISDEDEILEHTFGSTGGDSDEYEGDAQTTTAPVRRPAKAFGRPAEVVTTEVDASAATAVPDRSWRSRPTSTSRVSSSSTAAEVSSGGDLLGPEYAYLSGDLTASERKQLGLAVPEGWEWGSEHFELAKRLSTADVEYLENLPLTLWVEDLKSWIVHAGMVPWVSLRKTLARVSSASSSFRSKDLPDLLDSASDLSFSPSSNSLARQLAEQSTRTALLLEQPNTDPFTLLNMRTLSLTGGSSRSYTSNGKVIKGPPSEWSVSSKGRKASKASQPWWSVWESSMKDCAAKADEDEPCEEAGIIYGHWAGQGLTVQDHSVGLDSGCVYGRSLSALVVPLAGDSSSVSPLGKTLIGADDKSAAETGSSRESTPTATSHAQDNDDDLATEPADEDESDVAEEAAPTSTAGTLSRPKSQPNWHGGLNRVKGSPGTSSSSSSSESQTDLDSSAGEKATGPSRLDDSAAYDDVSSSYAISAISEEQVATSGSGSLESEAEEETTRPWWRPWRKRAPPQDRPGVAPWEAAVVSRDDERVASLTATASADATPTSSRTLKKLHASKGGDDEDEDEDEDANVTPFKSDVKQKGDSLREEQVILAQAPEASAWIVSVDCSSELSYQN
ncbi:hypothetical protein JCM10908_006743 [Rhodotorula pacifica]|uniref:uncharacterized protein n=1 Tax=Rhodotorula pacifica TaxID=1495444 RepID=UPI0031716793